MKKLIVLLLSVLMAFSLVACGKQTSQSKSQTPESDKQSETPDNTQDASQQQEQQSSLDSNLESGQLSTEESKPAAKKTLVVYFSATGNTKEAADYIAAATNADVFELKPKEPYSDDDLDWTDQNSRVSYEHENPNQRVVELEKSTVSDWESYDTVFIGYPIWWGIAAWPVDEFIKNNDFTGKTVVPFCTSASSGLGESGKLLEEAAKTGTWLEGQRFSSSVSEKTVQDWINGLEL